MRADHKSHNHGGRPLLLYTIPELHGKEDKLVPVDMEEVAECQNESIQKDAYICDRDMFLLCCILMEENEWSIPNDGYEAGSLYLNLRNPIRSELGIQ